MYIRRNKVVVLVVVVGPHVETPAGYGIMDRLQFIQPNCCLPVQKQVIDYSFPNKSQVTSHIQSPSTNHFVTPDCRSKL